SSTQIQRLMSVALCGVLVDSVAGDETGSKSSVALGIQIFIEVVERRQHAGAGLDPLLTRQTDFDERGPELRAVSTRSLERVREGQGRERGLIRSLNRTRGLILGMGGKREGRNQKNS